MVVICTALASFRSARATWSEPGRYLIINRSVHAIAEPFGKAHAELQRDVESLVLALGPTAFAEEESPRGHAMAEFEHGMW